MTSDLKLAGHAIAKYDRRDIAWILVWLLCYLIFITAVILTVGPESSTNAVQPDLWPDVVGRTSSEPRDRLLYVAWLSAAFFAVVSALIIARPRSYKQTHDPRRLASLALSVLLTGALFVFIAPGTEPQDDWRGVALTALVLGILSAFIVAGAYVFGGVARLVAGLGTGLVAVVYFIAAAWQSSASLRDPYHFGIVVEDVLRGASGKLPYIDFLPTYTAVLGAPLRIVQAGSLIDLTHVATYWILALQLMSVGVGFALVSLTLRRNTLGIALLVFAGPIAFVQSGTGQSALQSVAVMPGRVLIPLVGGLILVALYSHREGILLSRGSVLAGVGVIFGLGVINNLEFGGSAAAAAALAIGLSARSWPILRARVIALSLGVVAPVALYATYGAVFRATNVIDYALLIPLTYAAAGFDLHPIQSLGPFIIFLGVALIGVFLGVLSLRRNPTSRSARAAALVLVFTGLWTFLSMFYFTGRSFSSVLIAGQALQISIILGVLTRWLPVNTRLVRIYGFKPSRVATLSIAVLPVFLSATLLIAGGKPQSVLAYGLSGAPLDATNSAVSRQLEALKESGLWDESDKPRTIVIYGNSAMIAQSAGLVDGAFMLPGFVEVSRKLMQVQCEKMPHFSFLVVSSPIAKKMSELPGCRAVVGRQLEASGGSQVPEVAVFVGGTVPESISAG